MRKIFPLTLFILSTLFSKAQLPHVNSGTIKRLNNFPSKFVDARNVDVWLPEKYAPKKKYAVLYMHDGQMLFDSTTSWNHQEWGVDETLGKLMKEKKIRNCIVVGIWNNGAQRHAEYFPQRALDSPTIKNFAYLNQTFPNGPLADNYLKFIVTELKPYIDSTFSTRPEQENTFIAGSSMGGLISMYAICEYPEVFHGAACLSTHWTGIFRANNNPVPGAIVDYLKTHLPSPDNHKLYFDHGTKTLDSLYAPFQAMADEVIKNHGYTSANWISKEFPGEDHSENAWRKRLAIPAVFLLGKK
ncbi:MAG: alpha/beta hydrolase [Chitinophagaceae bacterium]|nr:alpha/beta hydrolase [Chitinophagaceae bacterium]